MNLSLDCSSFSIVSVQVTKWIMPWILFDRDYYNISSTATEWVHSRTNRIWGCMVSNWGNMQKFQLRQISCSTREKSFCKTWFQVGMELKKVKKQGRDERTQEDYPTSAKIHTRCRVVFLRSFISALFLYFFQLHPFLKSSFTETFFH